MGLNTLCCFIDFSAVLQTTDEFEPFLSAQRIVNSIITYILKIKDSFKSWREKQPKHYVGDQEKRVAVFKKGPQPVY